MQKQTEKLGTPITYGRNTWVQTERSAHEAWGKLTMRSPRAAAVMHHLVANMSHQNAVVIAQKTLAKLAGCSLATLKRALTDLEDERWIQVVQIGSNGTVNAYVVNSSVAWGEKRDQMRLAVFHASVVSDAADQSPDRLSRAALRKLPVIHAPGAALPDDAEDPPLPFGPVGVKA